MEFKKIDWRLVDGVARITLNDPDNHNTVDARFVRELAEVAILCETEPSVKVVLLAAVGPAFSFGGDLNEFLARRENLQAHIRQMTSHFHSAVLTLNRIPAPVVAAVNGMAAGGGFSLVCMSDLAIASRSAKFNSAYTRSGLTPDGGLTHFLTRMVGPQKAFDILATNPTLSAQEAQALGIIARVVEDQDFEVEVEALLQTLLGIPSDALPRLKGLLKKSFSASLEEQFEHEAKSVSEVAASPETLATLEGFLKR
ncbi:MAG: enoyl-CoA hydratase/isomerase family protein [Gammaproteobacteria bacterium]|nr:enoyl-CoA hydratase/isomerase family protein [Gammaproteobacteria bacterium]